MQRVRNSVFLFCWLHHSHCIHTYSWTPLPREFYFLYLASFAALHVFI
jgi:hypothetical protein